MAKRWAAAITVLGAMLLVPAAASAAVEVGDDCIANEAEESAEAPTQTLMGSTNGAGDRAGRGTYPPF